MDKTTKRKLNHQNQPQKDTFCIARRLIIQQKKVHCCTFSKKYMIPNALFGSKVDLFLFLDPGRLAGQCTQIIQFSAANPTCLVKCDRLNIR